MILIMEPVWLQVSKLIIQSWSMINFYQNIKPLALTNNYFLGDKKKYYMDTSTFLTGINQKEKGPLKLDDTYPRSSDINFYHSSLNGLITVSYFL